MSQLKEKDLNNKCSSILTLFLEFQKLKQIYRQGWLNYKINKNNCESVADHSFGVAILAIIINTELNLNLNYEKLILLALVHEIGEIIVGDITPDDNISNIEKYNLEKNAAKEILKESNNMKFYFDIWLEFENQTSPESIFIKQLDKLEMAIQANIYQKSYSLDLSNFIINAEKFINDKKLKNIINMLKN